MTENPNLDLQIILQIVTYMNNRPQTQNGGNATLSDILQNLPQGISIHTVAGAVFQPKEMIMGDMYQAGQGIQGPGAIARGNQFSQVWLQQAGEIDLAQLSTELRELRNEAKGMSSGDVEHDLAIGALASAEKAASNGDGPKALEYLREAGQWVLEVAKTIGVPVATKALAAALGLPG